MRGEGEKGRERKREKERDFGWGLDRVKSMVLDLELGQERGTYFSVVCVSQVGRGILQPCLGSRTEHAGIGP